MHGSRNFHQGGPDQSDKKALTFFAVFYLVLSLLDIVKWSISKFQLFPGGGGGPTFSRGGGPIGYSLYFPKSLKITFLLLSGIVKTDTEFKAMLM